MGDLRGITYLAYIGAAVMLIFVVIAPPAALLGLAWLLEPRTGEWIHVAAEILAGSWLGVCFLMGIAFLVSLFRR